MTRLGTSSPGVLALNDSMAVTVGQGNAETTLNISFHLNNKEGHNAY